MVYRSAVFTVNARLFQRLPHRPGERGQRLQILFIDGQRRLADQEEPVAAPGDVTGHRPVTRHLKPHLAAVTISRHVLYRDAAVLVQRGVYRADRGFYQMAPGVDAPGAPAKRSAR